ncbi:MAG TPA: TonB-dependent receptor [Caulobacteraceae bacterium]
MPHLRRLLLSSVLTGLAGAAAAQTQPEPDRVDDIVVTASPLGVSERASVIATDVVDEEQLAVAPAQSLGDLLAGRPGLRSTSFAPGASRPVIRGLSGPRVQVLTNGVGLIDASGVSPDHAVATDPAEANRIEVVRGPSTLIYGGSAIGGVVNILDNRIPTAMPEGVDGVVSTQASSVDQGRSVFGRATFGVGSFAFTIDGVTRTADDYEIPSPAISSRLAAAQGIDRGTGGGVQPNSWSQLEAWGVGGSYLGARGFIGASFKDTSSAYGTVAEPTVFIQLDQTREDFRGEYRFESGPFATVRGSWGHADYTHTEFEAEGEPGTVFQSNGWEARGDLVQRERAGWSGAVGGQMLSRTFEAIGDEAFVPSTEIEEGGVYTVQRFDRGRIGVEGGLRVDRRTLRATPIGAAAEVERAFDNWSASAAAFFRPAPGVFAGLSLSRTERAPSDVELFADGVHVATGVYETGDLTLDSEAVVTLEASLHADRGRFSGDLHLYAARYDGFIDERPTGAEFLTDEGELFPVFRFVQTGADFRGFEAEGRFALWESGQSALTLEGAADYVDAETDLGPAARIPPWSATARLAWTSRPFDAALEARTVGEQDETAELELPTDGYTLVNLSTAWRPVTDRNVTVFAELRNLTDEEAREHVSFLKDVAPLPGRNLRVGVAYRF